MIDEGRLKKIDFVLLFLLVIFYLATRLYRLTLVPVFCDEAIYIRWAQIMRHEPNLRFLPLQDGKQPLFMWLVMPALKVWSDPLAAGRFISVLAGLGTMLGVGVFFFLTIQNIQTVLWGMLLYVLVPFVLFFDRMALADSLLTTFGTWSLIFAILLGRTHRLDVAMILGMILGGALLTKSPAMFFVLMSPAVVMVESGFKIQKLKGKGKDFLKLVSLLGVSFLFTFGIYNILRLGPNFHMIAVRNKDYVWPISEILKHPFDPFVPHLKDIFRYYYGYLTFPVLILGILGMLGMLKEKKKKVMGAVVLGWWLIPLLVQAAIAKVFTARYILFSVPWWVILAAYGWQRLTQILKKKKWVYPIFWLLILLFPFHFDWFLWHNPVRAPFPQDEKRGYLQGWASGWGIKETAEYLENLPKDKPIVVGTEGFFGTLPDGLQMYLEGERRITVIGLGVPVVGISSSLLEAKAAGNQVYLVVNQSRLQMKKREKLRLVKEYPKPGGDKLLFFEIL